MADPRPDFLAVALRKALVLVSLLGVLVFGAGFVLSYSHPVLVEQGARELVRIEVERRVGAKLDSLSDSRITALARRALRQATVDIEATQAEIRQQLPRAVAKVVADMLDADCECRKRLVTGAEAAEREHLESLKGVRQRLTGLIESTYASVTSSLLREFRIFTAANAIAFALLGIVSFFRRRAALQLVLPAVVLLGAAAITGGVYLFQQDWLHTIVYGDYVGLAYALYLAGAALLLSDIVFNRARVTTRLVNAGLQVVGSALSAAPC